jgi:hypothetical protein
MATNSFFLKKGKNDRQQSQNELYFDRSKSPNTRKLIRNTNIFAGIKPN